VIAFTVYGKPQPAGSKRVLPAGGRAGGRPIVVDDAKGSASWKRHVATVARGEMAGARPLVGPVTLELLFTLERPRFHYGAHGVKPSSPPFPTVRPDLLKLARAIEDALTGICYLDDAQVVNEHLSKSYGSENAVQVRVAPLDPVTAGAARATVAA